MLLQNVHKITQWGYGDGALPITQYVAIVTAEILGERAKIDRRTPDTPTGYQRKLEDRRLGTGKTGIVGYLLNQIGIFPTSVLVNIRKEQATLEFRSSRQLAKHIELGELTIPDNATWFIIDGQHRIEGLKIAMREKPELSEYPITITITNEDTFYEMLMFYIVNDRAKSVPTSLAYRILQRMLYSQREGISTPKWIEDTIMIGADRRKAIAATITDFLNEKPESPFKGRIQLVGEPRKPHHLVTDETMTRYVSLVLRDSAFSYMFDEEVANLLASYWSAIAAIYPTAFAKPDEYMLLSTIGLSSFMRLFPTIYAYCVKEGDISTATMKKFLALLLEPTQGHSDLDFRNPIDENWWHKVKGPGIIHGTGEGIYTEVARKMAEKISIVLREKAKAATKA
jgi:DGQHR domain-containing protein